jgi:hypothetical protein
MSSSESSKTRTLDEALAMIDEMGGARVLISDLEEFERLQVRMTEEYDLLLEKHPDRWVAMGMDGLLAVGDSEEDVYQAVVNQGMRRSDVVVEFLDTDPPVLIL